MIVRKATQQQSQSVTDLLVKPGIGSLVLQAIRWLIRVCLNVAVIRMRQVG